jgi:hypothetical protein
MVVPVASAPTRCTSRAGSRHQRAASAASVQLRVWVLGLLVAMACVSIVVTLRAEPPADQRTEVERLKIEVLTLQAQLVRAIADGDACRGELGPVRTSLNQRVLEDTANRLVLDMEAAHPGYRVNRQTWTLEAAPPSPKGSQP